MDFNSGVHAPSSFLKPSYGGCVLATSTLKVSPLAPDMACESSEDKEELVERLLGTSGDFEAYFDHYQDLVCQRNVFLVQIDKNLPDRRISSKDVLVVVDLLKQNVGWTLTELQQNLRSRLPEQRHPPDMRSLISISIHASFMVDCGAKERHAADFSLGTYRPSSWLPEQKFTAFMESCLPQGLDTDSLRFDAVLRNKNAIRAWKLKKKLGITFRKTNDIAQHLVFDPRNNVLYIFHHAAFLKAHLSRWSKNASIENDMALSLAQ